MTMPVRRISKRRPLSHNHGLLLIRRQQRAVALIIFCAQARQQMLIRAHKRVLDLPLNLRSQECLLIKKASAALPRRRTIGQTIQPVVAIDAEHGLPGRSHGLIPLKSPMAASLG
ncbi:hypothetical protein V476_08875 [Pseudomonas syringae KCTC 12500]|nr:hypothetical protein V476_08875 [Pseudomonas syringae KCTC 12500]POR83093.1 hypothetical protein BKM21_24795 [Pseudomonas syringae pv. syringae]